MAVSAGKRAVAAPPEDLLWAPEQSFACTNLKYGELHPLLGLYQLAAPGTFTRF